MKMGYDSVFQQTKENMLAAENAAKRILEQISIIF